LSINEFEVFSKVMDSAWMGASSRDGRDNQIEECLNTEEIQNEDVPDNDDSNVEDLKHGGGLVILAIRSDNVPSDQCDDLNDLGEGTSEIFDLEFTGHVAISVNKTKEIVMKGMEFKESHGCGDTISKVAKDSSELIS